MGRKFAYIRVSTDDQDLSIQREQVLNAGVHPDLVFAEKVSGTKRDGREQLDLLLRMVQSGDGIVITRIDRLARSMRDLQNIVHELQQKQVSLKATEQPIDTSTAAGKAFLDMLGVFAEFETNLRRERQAEGIAKAKKAGKYLGRKPVITDDLIAKAKEKLAAGVPKARIAVDLGVSRMTIHRALKAPAPKHRNTPMTDEEIEAEVRKHFPNMKKPAEPTVSPLVNAPVPGPLYERYLKGDETLTKMKCRITYPNHRENEEPPAKQKPSLRVVGSDEGADQ